MISGIGYAELGKQASICKPDPEDMLQSARETAEEVNKVMDSIMQVVESPVRVGLHSEGTELLAILGGMVIKQREAEKAIEYWLKEIDKG